MGLLLLAAITAAIVAIILLGSLDPKYFEKISCEEEEPTPMHVNFCLRYRCPFDVTTCDLSCPFGYEAGESGCEIGCECATEGEFEGDIVFDENELPHLSKIYGYMAPEEDFDVFTGSASSGKLWNDSPEKGRHVIPYVMLPTVTKKAREAIKIAIKRYKEQTCIDFVERTNQRRYFRFASQKGCKSIVGKYRSNGQPVSIGKGCEIPGIVQHELKHLLGFYHEHARPDRDAYIQVIKANINKARWNNFKKKLKSQVRSFDSEYDLVSIMHYPSNAFTTGSGKSSILKRSNGEKIKAQRRALTKDDLLEINSLYDCLQHLPGARWTEWTDWRPCDTTCGVGEEARFRKCKDGDQDAAGCPGPPVQKRVCDLKECPKGSGSWSEWEKFGECSQSCDGGFHWRRRKCSGECDGPASEGRSCNKKECKDTPTWADWSAWSLCSKRCEGGKKTRKKQCYMGGNVPALSCEGGDGSGLHTESEFCNTHPCGGPASDADWGLWSSCSATCDGTRTRKRTCRDDGCVGEEEENAACNEGVCKDGPSMFEVEVMDVPEVLCDKSTTHSWHFGDFNGDKRTDAMCSGANGVFKLGHTESNGNLDDVNWSGRLRDCHGELFVGDFNGDTTDDVLCRDKEQKKLVIKLASTFGTFTDSIVDAGRFCVGQDEKLILMDANGDRKTDLVCYYDDKHVEIRLNMH